MGKFKDWAVFQRVGERKFRLILPLEFTTTDGGKYTVPRGYVSDLGSIPRCVWPLLPPSEFPSAYFLHDYVTELELMPWCDATKLLHEAIVGSNGAKWKAWIICAGVTLWGPLRVIIKAIGQKLT